jgi:hypothetical protein
MTRNLEGRCSRRRALVRVEETGTLTIKVRYINLKSAHHLISCPGRPVPPAHIHRRANSLFAVQLCRPHPNVNIEKMPPFRTLPQVSHLTLLSHIYRTRTVPSHPTTPFPPRLLTLAFHPDIHHQPLPPPPTSTMEMDLETPPPISSGTQDPDPDPDPSSGSSITAPRPRNRHCACALRTVVGMNQCKAPGRRCSKEAGLGPGLGLGDLHDGGTPGVVYCWGCMVCEPLLPTEEQDEVRWMKGRLLTAIC